MNSLCFLLFGKGAASFLATLSLISFSVFATALPDKPEMEPMILAESQTSQYRIYIPAQPVESVRLAAEELAAFFEKSTGAVLPILLDEAEVPEQPFISLGETSFAKSAGLEVASLRRDSHRLVSKHGNVFIFGPDEASHSKTNHFNGLSKGTLYGVYVFLEKVLEVRWLYPGEKGTEVPIHGRVVLAAVDETFEPQMFYRVIGGLEDQTHPDVQRWMLRNRSGYNQRIEHGHHWQKTVPASLFAKHPDWFAEFNGKRVAPSGHFKLETTNPELVNYVASQIKQSFKEEPERFSYSISPTDGQGWSQSEASRALDETAPDGKLSVSRRVIEFYNQVARQVGAEYPDRLLGGYVYDRYFFPPSEGVALLEPNLFLMIAPLQNYGFRLFRPEVRESSDAAIAEWTRAAKRWGYYDYPVTLYPNGAGMITPPGLKILGPMYRRLYEGGCEATYLAGSPAFGYGGVLNYLLARLSWDPSLDPQKVARDFYTSAYGPAAGEKMGALNEWWEGVFEAYYQQNIANYHITPQLVEGLHARHYAELETRYLAALDVAQAPRHVARLEDFGRNLSLLQWVLRCRGLIPVQPESRLYRSDAQIAEMIADGVRDFSLAQVKDYTQLSRTKEPAWQVEPLVNDLEPVRPPAVLFRGPTRWMIRPSAETVIRCTRMPLEEVVPYRISDRKGRVVASGILAEGHALPFRGTPGEDYFLDVICSRAAYGLEVEGGRYAVKADGRFRNKLWLHAVDGLFPPLYLIPEAASVEVEFSSISTGEPVIADLLDSTGQVLASIDTRLAPLQRAKVKVDPAAGPLRVEFRESKKATSRYAFIHVSKGASVWLGLTPQSLLKVELPGANASSTVVP